MRRANSGRVQLHYARKYQEIIKVNSYEGMMRNGINLREENTRENLYFKLTNYLRGDFYCLDIFAERVILFIPNLIASSVEEFSRKCLYVLTHFLTDRSNDFLKNRFVVKRKTISLVV